MSDKPVITGDNLYTLPTRNGRGGARQPPGDGGGGDTGHPMEQRVTELEKSLVRIDERLIRVDDRIGRVDEVLREIKSSVTNWKWQLLAATIAVAAIGWSIQQSTVSTFQAARETSEQRPAPSPPTVIVLPGATAVTAPQPAASPASR